MILETLTSYTPTPHALLTPGRRELYVETLDGSQLYKGKREIENVLEKLKGHTCYVSSSLPRLRHTTGATQWSLTTWKGRDIKITHIPTGVKVSSLQSVLESVQRPEDTFAELSECLAWIRQWAIAPASISSMSWKLLRASLPRSVRYGFDPEISEASFFGGRQEIWQPERYRDMKSLDIKAAYPSAMSARPIALSLREVDVSTALDPHESGLARAKVYVPTHLAYAPLPVRVSDDAIQFQYHDFEGTWTWTELAAAKSLGCDVEVVQCWAPRRTHDLFSSWWEMAQSGRSLSPGAANMAKAITNVTWGQFAMRNGTRAEIHWTDDKGEEEFEVSKSRVTPSSWGLHIAAEITSRVRVQTLLEGLYGAKNSWIVHCDTDGLILNEKATPINVGDGFGQWRVKSHINQVDIRAPQFYRYTERERPDEWQYVASGQTKRQAIRTFDKYPHLRTEISFLSRYDVNLPPGSSRDETGKQRLIRELKELVA